VVGGLEDFGGDVGGGAATGVEFSKRAVLDYGDLQRCGERLLTNDLGETEVCDFHG